VKRVEDNENDTVIIQRRAIRLVRDIAKGEIIQLSDVDFLRPCPFDAITPADLSSVIGSRIRTDKEKGDHFAISDLE
jgi:N-acetylneuraminate synthase